MSKKLVVTAIAVGLLASCQSTSTVPLSKDTVQINVSADPVCGGTGAQKVAVAQAAIVTINSGYDKFFISNSTYQNNVVTTQAAPTSYTTVDNATIQPTAGGYNTSSTTTTYANGGGTVESGSHDQSLVVKMLKADDPLAVNAVDARTTLGPDWQKIVSKKSNIC